MSEPYKRFMVFEVIDYYPAGGLSDVRDSFDTLNQALAFAVNEGIKTLELQIFDRETGEQVE